MGYDEYRLLYLIFMALAIVLLVIALVLFFVLKIPKVIGDLSGWTAKKGIENIRKKNEQSGEKTYKSSAVNKSRGQLTDKISASGTLYKRGEENSASGMYTEKIATMELPGGNETTLLSTGETTLLQENVTTVLNSGETAILSPAAIPLSGQADAVEREVSYNGLFEIECSITFIHTEERIPELAF